MRFRWEDGKGSVGCSPLQLLESISSIHTETVLTFVLNFFVDHLKLITLKRIKKIETDFSIVLLKSSCYAFNNINLYDYMNEIFYEAEGKKDINKDLTIIHICSSHLIKAVRKKIKAVFPDKKNQCVQRYVASNLVSALIHLYDIETAKIPLEALILIYD